MGAFEIQPLSLIPITEEVETAETTSVQEGVSKADETNYALTQTATVWPNCWNSNDCDPPKVCGGWYIVFSQVNRWNSNDCDPPKVCSGVVYSI